MTQQGWTRRTITAGGVAGLMASAAGAACARQPTLPAASGAHQTARISVVVRGQGPDVVLIPGLASSRAVWEGVAAHLEKTHRLHLVQVVGFSEPTAQPDGPVFEPVVQDILAYIRSAGLIKPALIGHSMGGTAALRIATSTPDAVGRLMIVDSLPFFSVLINPAATAETITPAADAAMARMLGQDADAFRTQQANGLRILAKSAAAQASALEWSVGSNRSVMARMMRDVMVTDLRADLGKVTAPVTVVYAWDVLMMRPAQIVDQLYALNYTGVQILTLKRIDGAFHFVMLDQPALFAGAVSGFLA
jgi:pimeloyl-[acyl-carrier protein] methyl ester esterase